MPLLSRFHRSFLIQAALFSSSMFLTHPTSFFFFSPFARTIFVRLVSSVGTGFFYTYKRPRLADKLTKIKFDPIGKPFAVAHSTPLPLFCCLILVPKCLFYILSCCSEQIRPLSRRQKEVIMCLQNVLVSLLKKEKKKERTRETRRQTHKMARRTKRGPYRKSLMRTKQQPSCCWRPSHTWKRKRVQQLTLRLASTSPPCPKTTRRNHRLLQELQHKREKQKVNNAKLTG